MSTKPSGEQKKPLVEQRQHTTDTRHVPLEKSVSIESYRDNTVRNSLPPPVNPNGEDAKDKL